MPESHRWREVSLAERNFLRRHHRHRHILPEEPTTGRSDIV